MLSRDCPSHSRALSNLAVIHWSNNQKDEAISFAADALKADENNIEANLNLAEDAFRDWKVSG